MKDLKKYHSTNIQVYESRAKAWDCQRSKIFLEKFWIDRVIMHLKPGSDVLDLGCGAGIPISEYIISKGFSLVGVDAARSMIDICQERFPDSQWLQMDIRNLELNKKFNAILSWDAFFHLSQDEQRKVLVDIAKYIQPGGVLLLTIGDREGEVLGAVDGEIVYHSSLSENEYRQILEALGFVSIHFVFRDPECGDRSIVFAIKS
ncbi:class I SAM-dependent methyltransferase [Baaleninema simplex]|uniref:class I SAM-dependent methyltransferase n=1 Tax=Baaleninema simplex TaxID=2862350 RepID=UPI0003634FDC|nr:class I SAM-dependent methyltransferase [Baaleninema simplex]